MDNTQEINYSIIIKNNPDKPTLQLLNTYWFFEKGIFPNKPKQLSTENKLRIHDIYVVIKEYSYVELQYKCRTCDMILEQEVYSQSNFLQILKDEPICELCEIREELKIEEEINKLREQKEQEEKKKNELYSKLNAAVEHFEETQFNKEEARFMLHFIREGIKKISFLNHGENYEVFYKFNLLGLIHLQENIVEKYLIVSYSHKLEDLLMNWLNKETSENKTQDTSSWSRLSFLLENNRSYRNSNTPRFSGTISFKEDIIIKKHTKCLYGVWDRPHDDAWFTLTSTSDIIVANNKPIHKEPKHIRDILNRFLDNPENRDF